MPLLAHSTMTLPSIVNAAATGSSSATSTTPATNVPSSSMTVTTSSSTASSSSLSMTMKRKHTLMGCQKFVGAPLTRDQARAKMESSPQFKQLAIESQGWTLSSLFGSSNSNNSSNRRSTRMFMTTSTTTCEGGGGAVAGSNHEESMSLELIDRAVALDYGSRLRACLLRTEKVKHSTPY